MENPINNSALDAFNKLAQTPDSPFFKTGFTSYEEDVKQVQAYILEKQSATITLSEFAITQIIMGVRHLVEGLKQVDAKHVTNLSRLYTAHMDVYTHGTHGEASPTLEVKRDEVLMYVEYIKARMKHCEGERAIGSKRFNPDTYIGQKLLLLELLEWLMGTVSATPHLPECAIN